jgi:hypothetical protein
MKIFIYILLFVAVCFSSCNPARKINSGTVVLNDHQEMFWNKLRSLCGKAFKGEVFEAPANDTVFRNKALFLHIRSCEENRIRTPFVVGDNRSRTFIITRENGSLQLKHDHRHNDGVPDSITLYGGRTSNSGSANVQFFPADQHTVNILPAAAGNVWWLEIVDGRYLSYNLRRMGTDRLFTVRFDITQPVTPPEAPWGWQQ